MGLDGTGYAHISYYDSTNADLKYAYQDAVGWHTQTLDSTQTVGEFTSLDVDDVGNPHIVYNDSANYPHIIHHFGSNSIDYAYQNASGWHIEIPPNTTSTGFYQASLALSLDSANRPHIAYYDDAPNNLGYGYQDGSGWHFETVENLGTKIGSQLSLALDSTGKPRIVYYHNTQGLKHAVTSSPILQPVLYLPFVTK
ncbi:MAG TPA: hypothetical protein PKW33_11015 [Anaerolineaceae bacterium]|nr:hypothetical protein [Anaerolineaceae bacterium]HPN52109.1 hypothetical protein [Anaerolineaceae bacterium]